MFKSFKYEKRTIKHKNDQVDLGKKKKEFLEMKK